MTTQIGLRTNEMIFAPEIGDFFPVFIWTRQNIFDKTIKQPHSENILFWPTSKSQTLSKNMFIDIDILAPLNWKLLKILPCSSYNDCI